MVEVQNHSHDWAITVEGIRLEEKGSEREETVKPAIWVDTARIEPRAACFAPIGSSQTSVKFPVTLRASVNIKTKRRTFRSNWEPLPH